MRRLRRAIYDKFEGEFELVGLVTGLFYTEAPEDTAYPYAVFSLVTDTKIPRFDSRAQDFLIRFNFFSQDTRTEVNAAERIADAFDAIFDECSFLVEGRDFGFFLREQRTAAKVKGVWQESILYRCLLDQTD